jgi:hypothetical protein
MRIRASIRGALASFVLSVFATGANAIWLPDGKVVVSEVNDQSIVSAVTDGTGGVIVVWEDKRFGALADIYAQRIDASGTADWPVNGVPVCVEAGNQLNAAAASDGAGGVIIMWEDYRNGGDIYAQRVDANGSLLWGYNGIPVCVADNLQVSPEVIPYAGGVIVTWYDRRSDDFDIYAQRVDSNGDTLWTGDGVPVCAIASSTQQRPRLADDLTGRVIITWEDRRSGVFSDIYAQCLDAAGVPQWVENGVPVCTDTLSQLIPDVVPDDSGGAVIVWEDSRTGDSDIYAQRLNSSGVPVWKLNGEVVCDAVDSQLEPLLVSDGASGAIVVWSDYRDFTHSPDVYAQRINHGGVTLWATDGEAVCTAIDAQYLADVKADGVGGAYFSWSDSRTGDSDIYVQRLNASGAPQWTVDGAVLCSAAGYQSEPLIATDGSGCPIVAWTDPRDGDNNVYAKITPGCTASGVDADAQTPHAGARLYQNFPNPFSGATRFDFDLPNGGDVRIEVFDVRGRRVHFEYRPGLSAGMHSVEFHGGMTAAASLPAGVYYYRMTVAGASETRKMLLLK